MTATGQKVDIKKCYTPKLYAERFGIPLSTVYHQIKNKYVKTIEIAGTVFIYKG